MDTKETKKAIRINFYSIISILTLLVMGAGATLAYFNASVTGDGGNVVTSSIQVILNLKISHLYTGMEMLPTNDEDIFKAFDNKCLDDRGAGACLAYTVEIENLGQIQEGEAFFVAESDTIENLKYIILDNDNDYALLKGPTSALKREDSEVSIPVNLATNQNKKITLVVWISNLDEPQDYEQAGTFQGQVTFESTMGGRITGTMDEKFLIGS